MSKVERLYHLHNILSQRRTPISRQDLMERLECSQATLYRLVAELRDLFAECQDVVGRELLALGLQVLLHLIELIRS